MSLNPDIAAIRRVELRRQVARAQAALAIAKAEVDEADRMRNAYLRDTMPFEVYTDPALKKRIVAFGDFTI